MKDTINIKVKVTKEILRKSMMCGINNTNFHQNCAIALAIREVFPDALVCQDAFFAFGAPISEYLHDLKYYIYCQHNGSDFISQFDDLVKTPKKRLELPETEVTLFLTEECVDHLNSVEGFNWREVIEKSELLSFEG